MALQLVQWDDNENKFKRGGASPDFRAGRSNVGVGVSSVTVTFSSPLPDTTYTVLPALQNTVDAFPQIQPVLVTGFSVNGFTATWVAPTDSANYKLNWLVFAPG